MINGARKIYVPFWVDFFADADDPYTTDCSLPTTKANPHAYAEFTIVNGELDYESFICIEKAPVYSEWSEYSSCSATCGEGFKTRRRRCIGGICSRATESDLSETTNCNKTGCKYYKAFILSALIIYL